jgi:hypothetical protein
MATVTSRSKTAGDARAAQHARSLARNAMKEASDLTIRVLEGGKSPRPAKKKKRSAPAKTNDDASTENGAEAMVAPIGFRADVTPQLQSAAPAFGDVLRSLAHAAALTQTGLNESALASLKTLASQQVEIPVLIEQELDDYGVPTTATIRTQSVPLTSLIEPSRQMINELTVQMDMRVESFDATSGVKFNQNMASGGVSYKRHGFGFGTSVNNTNVNAQFSNLSNFSSGSVLVSMDISDDGGFEVPAPLEYGIGANLMINVLGVTQNVATSTATPPVTTVTRTATISVKQAKTDGSVVALGQGQYGLTVPPGLQFTQGATLQVSRNPATVSEPYEERTIYITMGPAGQLTKTVKIYL